MLYSVMLKDNQRSLAIELGPRRCPFCGSHHVRRSHTADIFDILLRLVLMRPFRCLGCDERFYGFFFRKLRRVETAPAKPAEAVTAERTPVHHRA